LQDLTKPSKEVYTAFSIFIYKAPFLSVFKI